MSQPSQIASLLRPRSIAVVGASAIGGKLAGEIVPILQSTGFSGRIYPVNPRYEEVAGYPCYPSVSAIPEEVEHCIVVVAKQRVAAVLAECRDKGVTSASIFSSGYAEVGSDGISEQQKLVEAAGDMVFVGPNCMGCANLVNRVVTAPSAVITHDSTPGDVALLTQSGGLGYGSFAWFGQTTGVKFSHIVNTGNSAGVNFTDLVAYFNDESATRAILVVAESERVVGEVIEAVRRFGLVKPIVMMKLGRGETGTRMALSHTGSLAGDYRMLRDVAEQHGVVCVEDIDDALTACDLLRSGIDASNAEGIAAISISGGNITLFADHVDQAGLRFAELREETEARLATVLPDYISVHNPIDITSLGYEDPALHTRVFDIVLTDPAARLLVPIITTVEDYTPVCEQLAALKQRTGAALVTLWTGGSYDDRALAMLRAADIPVARTAGGLTRSLAAIGRAGVGLQREAPRMTNGPTRSLPGQGALLESEAMAFLGEAGLPVPPGRHGPRSDVARLCVEVGYPVVIKSDASVTHLSDQGGVILDVRDAADLARRAPQIDRLGDRLVVSRFLPGDELVLSTFRHPLMGPVMMVGSGGRLVELLKDVAFIALPAGREDMARALGRTAIGDALRRGFRGATGFGPAVDFMERLSDITLSTEGLAQIELNPVTVGHHGAAAVDAAVMRQEA
jgi:acyl-CoA synthetase (NDP forming)